MKIFTIGFTKKTAQTFLNFSNATTLNALWISGFTRMVNWLDSRKRRTSDTS